MSAAVTHGGGHNACMGPPIWRPIIRQNPNQPALPDFRNMGTIPAHPGGGHLGAAVLAFARAGQLASAYTEWVEGDRVRRTLPAAGAGSAVGGVAVAVAAVLWRRRRNGSALTTVVSGYLAVRGHGPVGALPPGTLARWIVFGLVAVAVLLFYFHLRARALSPAITEARLQALQARIRPHFLFNSINAVLSLVRSDPSGPRSRSRIWPTSFGC